MLQPLYPPPGPQLTGEVLDSGFRIFKRSLVRCAPLGWLAMITGQLQNIYFIAAGRPLAAFGGGDPVWLALFLAGAVLTLFLMVALILRQFRLAVGRPLGLRAELAQALRRLPGYLLLIIITSLLMGLLAMLPVLGYFALARVQLLTALIVAVVLALPMMYIMTPLTSASPAVLLDGMRPVQALNNAVRLTRGSWWRVSGVLAVAGVVTIVFYFVAMLLVMMALPLLARVDLASITAATTVVYVVLGGVSLPFLSAVMLAVYGELKVRRQGLDLEQRIATVVQS